MENFTIETIDATQRCTSGFTLPTTAFWATDDARTGISSVDFDVRVRPAATAVKGHMALIAYVPGVHAWSPPIC